MNKKFLALLSAGALTATLLAGCGSGGNTDPSTAEPSGEEGATLTTIESGKLIMSTNAQFPPYELVSDGEGYEGTGYEGIDVEIAYALAQKLGLPQEYRSIGILTADSDDVTYCALDEATKAAAVEVVYGRSLYAGAANASTKLAGEVIGILAGPNPAEVQSGLRSCVDFMESGVGFVSAN